MSEILSAIAGGIIGAVFSSIAFLYKRRLDNLANLQVSLYRLLELSRSIKLSKLPSVDVQLDWYIEVANEIFPEENLDKMKREVKQFMGPIIRAASSDLFQDDEEEGLLFAYTETIAKLGPVAPLLAHRLSANTSLKKMLREMDQYHENAKSLLTVNASEQDIETLNAIFGLVQTRVSKDIFNELRRDILWLAFRCGFTSWLQLAWQFYVRREETIESILKREYRTLLLDIKARGTSAVMAASK